MADTINNQNINNWSWAIDLNDLNNNDTAAKENNQNESLIGKINDDNLTENYEGIDLRQVKSTISNNTLWISKNAKLMTLFVFIILITWAIWFIFYKYDKYVIDYSNWIENSRNSIVDFYEKYKEKIYNIIWKEYEKPNTSFDISDEVWKRNLTNLIQSDKGFIYKKETIKNSLRNLFGSINENTQKLDDAKKQLSSNWFFADKLSHVISDNESITSIQDSLTAIEAIKFSSAITVFSKLDTFIESLSKELWMWKEEILTNISKITKRWERDINLYIKNCRLNTFEIDYNCNSIWDFDKYYELTEDTGFDTKFFKKLIEFIDEKLEQTEIPSFTIKFRSFNKQTDKLTFDIQINTFKEDELELAKKWILSAHSFILNSLINNLKLSRAIVSEWIEVKTIDVVQRTITIWTTIFTVNTSNKTFSVQIKNENQIEIDDFLY